MPGLQILARQPSQFTHWHVRTSHSAYLKIEQAAKLMGMPKCRRGKVLEICADAIVAHAQSLGRPVVRYGRLDAASVRAIRRSQAKIIAIASEHGISEAMVCAIRARSCYKWVGDTDE